MKGLYVLIAHKGLYRPYKHLLRLGVLGRLSHYLLAACGGGFVMLYIVCYAARCCITPHTGVFYSIMLYKY
jgi:hypothetical protein